MNTVDFFFNIWASISGTIIKNNRFKKNQHYEKKKGFARILG